MSSKPKRSSYLSIFLFLILLPSSQSLLCFSTDCQQYNNAEICNQYCHSTQNACHTIAHFDDGLFNTLELGCTVSYANCSNECILQKTDYGNVHYCCCHDDFCNHRPGETDAVNPTLSIATELPTIPVPNSSYLICEKYNCTNTLDSSLCYHGYEICNSDGANHFCLSTYYINGDNKLDLFQKGCLDSKLLGYNCSTNDNCHVDNPLNGSASTVYACCCHTSLCNQNESFTHQTELDNYGFYECIDMNCHHSCVIEDNNPKCLCDDGYALYNGTMCEDIDECNIANGGCEHVCINTQGSHYCVCANGYYFDSVTKACQSDDGIVCASHTCGIDITKCSEPTIEHCALTVSEDLQDDPSVHFCQSVYALINGSFIPRFQSCFGGAHVNCRNEKCSLKYSLTDDYGDVYFCCCYGDLCNAHDQIVSPTTSTSDNNIEPTRMTSKNISTTNTTSYVSETFVMPSKTLIKGKKNISPDSDVIAFSITLPILVILIIIASSIVVVVKCWIKEKDRKPDIDNVSRNDDSPVLHIDPCFDAVIGRGRFAEVYHAKLIDQEVAIKIFNNTLPSRESWNREKDIYSTPMLEHRNILHFMRSERRYHEGSETFWLIFEFHFNGSLYDYLQHRTVSLKQFCNLAQSAACGLAHLHSEIAQDRIVRKPAIAHRDLKSKNILVKSDLTCAISDFGLAIKFNPGEHPIDEAQGQVGTSRYMAPEVLEGAICFHQESFLRIDVYAFGLVLWEIASRCVIPNNPVGEYCPPFEDIVSPNPSIEEMKRLVAEKQKRPEIPRGFLVNPDYETVVEAITESWDRDAEARPSAHLIETRLKHFRDLIDPQQYCVMNHFSKESGFVSLNTHQGLNSPMSMIPCSTSFNTPLPPTPSSSPSITFSPSELKGSDTNMDSGSIYVDVYNRSISAVDTKDDFNLSGTTVHSHGTSQLHRGDLPPGSTTMWFHTDDMRDVNVTKTSLTETSV